MNNEELDKILIKADNDLDNLKDRCHDLYEENQRLKDLCNKYEEEHNTTFQEWQKGYCELKELCDKGQLDCKNEEYFNMAQQNMKLVLTIDKAIEYIKDSDITYLANKNATIYKDNIEVVAIVDRLNNLLNILQNGSEDNE